MKLLLEQTANLSVHQDLLKWMEYVFAHLEICIRILVSPVVLLDFMLVLIEHVKLAIPLVLHAQILPIFVFLVLLAMTWLQTELATEIVAVHMVNFSGTVDVKLFVLLVYSSVVDVYSSALMDLLIMDSEAVFKQQILPYVNLLYLGKEAHVLDHACKDTGPIKWLEFVNYAHKIVQSASLKHSVQHVLVDLSSMLIEQHVLFHLSAAVININTIWIVTQFVLQEPMHKEEYV